MASDFKLHLLLHRFVAFMLMPCDLQFPTFCCFNSPLSCCLHPHIEKNVSPHIQIAPFLCWLNTTYMLHAYIMSEQCNHIVFSQLAHRIRETVSSFDYSHRYQDKDGWFSNKDSGPACLFSQSVVFPKVSKQYSKCFTTANQDRRLSKL